MKLPISEKEWYKLRDDRTFRSDSVDSSSFKGFKVGIKVSHQVEDSFSIQVMTLLTLNMLSRWCREIIVEIPPVKSLLDESGNNLSEIILEMMHSNDPFGNFKIKKIDLFETDVTLNIGTPQEGKSGSELWIDSSGWLSVIGKGIVSKMSKFKEDRNIIGPSFAACLGVSELLHICLHAQVKKSGIKWYSLYNKQYSEDISPVLINPQMVDMIDLGNVHIIGHGAVGSSLTFLLGLTKWTGRLKMIDFDTVEIPNCSSSLLFNAESAFTKCMKVDAGYEYLQNSGFNTETFHGSYTQFLESASISEREPDIILCLANEQNVWNTIQTKYPPLLFHATTTSSWGINVGRHIPLIEWCIMCRFEKEMSVKFKPICGTSEISNVKEKILGTLPFLSPSAAIVLLSELVKSLKLYHDKNNFFEFSFRPSFGGNFLTRASGKRPDCNGCSSQYQHIYRKLRQSSKFWNLTE